MSVQGWRTKEPSNLDVKPELPNTVRSLIETRYKSLDNYALKEGLQRETAMALYAHA
jgi:hypothetical protein